MRTQVWTQVLQVQWSDSETERRLVGFREGEWEWPLIKLWVSLNWSTSNTACESQK